MQGFEGLPVRPYCAVTECAPVRIDRVHVRGFRTLFGKTLFVVYGQLGERGEAEPVSGQYAAFRQAWDAKAELEQQIAAARIGAGARHEKA